MLSEKQDAGRESDMVCFGIYRNKCKGIYLFGSIYFSVAHID